jgi:putative addiction module component (TIGR02574 family)
LTCSLSIRRSARSTGIPKMSTICNLKPKGVELSINHQSSLAIPPAAAYPQTMEVLTSDEIIRLTPPERIALIAQLWDSLEDDQLPLTNTQQTELESRLASLDEDRQNGVTWAALKAELEQRCP